MADWPNNPSLPVGPPSGWVAPPQSNAPAVSPTLWTSQQIEALRIRFQESLMQLIVLAVTNVLLSGETAFNQLQAWAADLSSTADGAADDIAELIDGVLGTGHAMADLVNYLQAIPGSVIDGITAVEQLILDAIANALGHAGTGHTPSDIQGYLAAIPASLISGVTTVEQQIIDAINASVGAATGGAVATIQAALEQIPPANVVGQWSSTLSGDLTNFLGAVSHGAAGLGIPTSFSAVQTALSGIASLLGYQSGGSPPANSTAGITTTNNTFISQLSGTRPLFFDPTADCVFDPTIINGSSPTTISVTQSVSAIGNLNIQFGGVAGTDLSLWPKKKSIPWLGSGPTTTTITAMWLTIWKMNSNGTKTFIHQSPELISTQGVATTLAWNYYNIPNSVDWLSVGIGEWYSVEMSILGSGTYALVGMPNNWMPASSSSIFPKARAETRRAVALDATIANTGANGANNNTKSGTGSITITTTIDTNATCLVLFTSHQIASGSANAAWTATVGAGGSIKSLSNTSTAGSGAQTLRGWTLFFQDGSGNPTTAGALGISGSQNIILNQTGAGVGTWNASMSAQTFIGPTSAGTPVTTTGTSTVPAVTQSTAVRKSFVAVAFASNTTMSGVTNWNNIAAGNVNVGGTFPLIAGYANGPTASTTYSTTSANAAYWGMEIPLNVTAPATLGVPGAIGLGGTGIQSSSNIPFFALCGAAGVSQHPDDIQVFTSSGTYNKPTWASKFYRFAFGGGGGGQNGSGFVAGVAGFPGNAVSDTIYASDPNVAAASTFAIAVGAGGGASSNGGPSTVDITGLSQLYSYGGAGGVGFVAGAIGGTGPGAGSTTQGPYTYSGGGNVGAQTTGSFPGGGGGGGNSATAGGSGPGAGGQGMVVIIAVQ